MSGASGNHYDPALNVTKTRFAASGHRGFRGISGRYVFVTSICMRTMTGGGLRSISDQCTTSFKASRLAFLPSGPWMPFAVPPASGASSSLLGVHGLCRAVAGPGLYPALERGLPGHCGGKVDAPP